MTLRGLSAATIALWSAIGISAASADDVAGISALYGAELPADYVDFLRTYGFATWHDGAPSRFDLHTGEGDIQSMLTLEQMEASLPYVASGFLPVAGDYSGHAFIMLRMTPPDGSVWYQYDNDDPVLIAESFGAFLADLHDGAAPPDVEKWRGTPITDAATGFTIAQETREAWAAYGTGATPEPADEIQAIEASLDRALPEALRTFLSTYGYVTFFGDALATFDLPAGAGQAQDQISVIYSTVVLQRNLPIGAGDPFPFASTALPDGTLSVRLDGDDAGQVLWQPGPETPPIPVADDLRTFLAGLYTERPVDE